MNTKQTKHILIIHKPSEECIMSEVGNELKDQIVTKKESVVSVHSFSRDVDVMSEEFTEAIPFVLCSLDANQCWKKFKRDPRFIKLNGEDIPKCTYGVSDWGKGKTKISDTDNIVEEIYKKVDECKKKNGKEIFLCITKAMVYIKYSKSESRRVMIDLLSKKKSER